jgi:hypothetical protein
MFDWLKGLGNRKTDHGAHGQEQPSMPPLTTFKGWLRNHKQTRNNIWGNAAFNLAFPQFAPPAWTEEDQRRALTGAFQNLDYVFFQPSQHRRWGGYELDRGCYFSVARDESGDDSGTLAAELNAYRDMKRQDVIVAATDGYAFSEEFAAQMPEAIRKVRKSCILVSVFPAIRLRESYEKTERTRDPQAHLRMGQLDWLTGESLAHVMVLPIVQWCEIPNVVDLRLPEVRAAFFSIFQTGTEATEHAIEISGVATYSRPYGNNISRFEEMIPEFISPYLGGTDEGTEGVTQNIGAYLRNMGASALIFPSARNDCGVEFKDGTMTNHWGWNLVDFRSSKPSFLSAHTVNVAPWLQTCLAGISIESPNEGQFAGSLAIRGVRSASANLYEAEFGKGRSELMARLQGKPPVTLLRGSDNLDELRRPK